MSNDERFLVSGWEDDLLDIDESRNPKESHQKEILQACEKGDLKRVKELVAEDPGLISATDKDKYTPLHRACYSNHSEIVKFLVESGADISAKTEMLWEPLHSCCQWNNVDCASVLIQHGANVNAASQGSQTPLHVAASHGASYETIQMLLMHPYVDPLLKNNSKETANDIARRSSKYYNVFEAVDPLLDYKNLLMLK